MLQHSLRIASFLRRHWTQLRLRKAILFCAMRFRGRSGSCSWTAVLLAVACLNGGRTFWRAARLDWHWEHHADELDELNKLLSIL